MIFLLPKHQKTKIYKNKKNKLNIIQFHKWVKIFFRPEIKQNFESFENPVNQKEIFAKLIDKLETMIHISNEKCAGFTTAYDYEFILKYCDKYNIFPELKNLIDKIKNELEKCYLEFKNKKQ